MRKIYKILCALAILSSAPLSAHAATLVFSPFSGDYAGTTLVLTINVASEDQAINAASGVVVFPKDLLEVTSLSKNGSIFNLWVHEPSFSNSKGTINFEGIVLNPGFTGSSGKILTVTFRIKGAGEAPISFASGSILANDGLGTNILRGFGKAQFTLHWVPKIIPQIVSPTPTSTLDVVVEGPNAPIIVDYQREIAAGEPIVVHGLTYPNSRVVVWFQKENEEPRSTTIQSDNSGGFTFTAPGGLTSAVYRISAEAIDARGARSLPSEVISVTVKNPTVFQATGLVIVLIGLLLLLLILLLIAAFRWYGLSAMRKRLKKEADEAAATTREVFTTMEQNIYDQLKVLEKTNTGRRLTDEEELLARQLKRDVELAEKSIVREIKDVQDEVR